MTEPADPIPEVFPPDEPAARFVVSMAMAKNDIERAPRDVRHAVENNALDFSYRVRLSIGHLVEALDALSAYSKDFVEVRTLTNGKEARAPAEPRDRFRPDPSVRHALPSRDPVSPEAQDAPAQLRAGRARPWSALWARRRVHEPALRHFASAERNAIRELLMLAPLRRPT